MEAVGYILIYFLCGRLPWQDLRCRNFKKQAAAVFSNKISTTVEELCAGHPTEFAELLTCMRNYAFFQTPDYEGLRNILRRVMQRNGWEHDGRYDWVVAAEEA